jgi:hypothetical protein
MKTLSLLVLITGTLLLSGRVHAQDDLLLLLESESANSPARTFTEATFKGSRLVNGHTVETRKSGTLEFLISHRFGPLNSGAYEFFGLDGANIRLGLDYGLTDRFTIGLGRSSFEKTYDGFLKYKLLRQGPGRVPVSATFFASVALRTLKAPVPDASAAFSDKLFYSYQLLIARKFSERFSLQIAPSLIHRNQISEREAENDLLALGAGARYKLTKRISLNAEYYHRLNAPEATQYYNSLAIGFDIETGGHVFQLHLTNSRAMIEKSFIGETAGDFRRGDIHFGFNISRTF